MADTIKKRYSSTLKHDLFDTIERYSKETDINKTKIIERALTEYFNNRNFEIREGK